MNLKVQSAVIGTIALSTAATILGTLPKNYQPPHTKPTLETTVTNIDPPMQIIQNTLDFKLPQTPILFSNQTENYTNIPVQIPYNNAQGPFLPARYRLLLNTPRKRYA